MTRPRRLMLVSGQRCLGSAHYPLSDLCTLLHPGRSPPFPMKSGIHTKPDPNATSSGNMASPSNRPQEWTPLPKINPSSRRWFLSHYLNPPCHHRCNSRCRHLNRCSRPATQVSTFLAVSHTCRCRRRCKCRCRCQWLCRCQCFFPQPLRSQHLNRKLRRPTPGTKRS